MENEAPRPNCVLEVSSCFCETCCKKIEKRFSKIKGVISVVAEPKKKWVHIAGTADLSKLLNAIEKQGRKVEVIYYCKINPSNYKPTKENTHHKTKDDSTCSSSTKSMGKNSFRGKKDEEDEEDEEDEVEEEEDHLTCGDSEDNGNDDGYEDAHARYKSRVHKRESHTAARPSPPPPKPRVRGFGDDFMDADVAYHLRAMRSAVPQPMSHSGYMYAQPPQYGGYYGGGSYAAAAYEAAPPRAYQYGYNPYYNG